MFLARKVPFKICNEHIEYVSFVAIFEIVDVEMPIFGLKVSIKRRISENEKYIVKFRCMHHDDPKVSRQLMQCFSNYWQKTILKLDSNYIM